MHNTDGWTAAANATLPDPAAIVSRLLQIETRQQQGETITFLGVIREDAAEQLDDVRRLLQPRAVDLSISPGAAGRRSWSDLSVRGNALVGGESLGQPVVLGPLAFAGYLGLVVTAFNLAPIGQLDGGHVAYALLGRRRAEALATTVIALMLVAGFLYARHWLMWALIAWLVPGRSHPGAWDETRPVGTGRALLGGLAVLILLAIVLPWPT